MAIKRNKVAIIGVGPVGSATAFSIITQGICDDVYLLDINQERAAAEAMDLQNCIEYLNRNAKITVKDYPDLKDADIIVITAAAPYQEGQTRLDMLDGSVKIIKDIVPKIMQSGFNGHIIVITNPVDIIAYYIYQLSGLPKNQIIGTGTGLDSARLKNQLSDLIHVDPRSINAYTLGEHGDSQMIPWSTITVGNKRFYDILNDNPERLKDVDMEAILQKTKQWGWDIAKSKGTTNFGIATTTVGIIKAIIHDENKIITVSTLLDGEFGFHNVFAGVPSVINNNGVKEIVELNMPDAEYQAFKKSISVIQEYTEKLPL